jgi:hypothetical protein
MSWEAPPLPDPEIFIKSVWENLREDSFKFPPSDSFKRANLGGGRLNLGRGGRVRGTPESRPKRGRFGSIGVREGGGKS